MNRLITSFLGLIVFVSLTSLRAENITVIGIGRLGLCMALAFEKAGYNVVGVDVNDEYVEKINTKTIYFDEPNLNNLLKQSQNFRATTSLNKGLVCSDIIFILISTTTGASEYDFESLIALLSNINKQKIKNKDIVICSTVIPGFINNTARALLSDCENITINYNAPFVAQGSIVKDFLEPEVVLIGGETETTRDLLENIYSKVCFNKPYLAKLSPQSAEIAKIAANCFSTMKVTFANLIGDIADSTPNADKYALLNAIGYCTRIGNKCLQPGYGFGGPCWPRDNNLLAKYVKSIGLDPTLFQDIDKANKLHTEFQVQTLLHQNLNEYVFKDMPYKANCPVKILENSQKLEIAIQLAGLGRNVTIIDDIRVIDQLKIRFGSLFRYIVE